jgi:hypothetical protein
MIRIITGADLCAPDLAVELDCVTLPRLGSLRENWTLLVVAQPATKSIKQETVIVFIIP